MRPRASEAGWADGRTGGWRTAFALLILSAHSSVRLCAQDQPLNAAALFLLFPVGARSVATGQAAAASEGRGEVVFQNPAGVASLTSSEFALHTSALAAGPTTAITAFFPRRGIGVFGATFYLADYGTQPNVDSNGVEIGQNSSRNLALLATFAAPLTSGISLGVSYKLIQFRVDCSGGGCLNVPSGEGVTHALDVGGQFTVGADHELRIGVALRNLGFPLQVNNKDQADPLPTRLTVGATYKLQLRPVSEDSSENRFDVRMLADVESPLRQTGNPDVRVGVDVGYQELVRVRGGYAFQRAGLSGPSLGVGLKTGAIGVDLAQLFLTGTDLITNGSTFLSFRVVF